MAEHPERWMRSRFETIEDDGSATIEITETTVERGWSAPISHRITRKPVTTGRTATAKTRTRARTRGAGRPRASAARSSAKSGDSGSDDSGSSTADPAPLGAIAERRVRTLLQQVQRHQPASVEAIRNLPRLAWYIDAIYYEALDAAIARGRLVEGPTGRPIALIGVIA